MAYGYSTCGCDETMPRMCGFDLLMGIHLPVRPSLQAKLLTLNLICTLSHDTLHNLDIVLSAYFVCLLYLEQESAHLQNAKNRRLPQTQVPTLEGLKPWKQSSNASGRPLGGYPLFPVLELDGNLSAKFFWFSFFHFRAVQALGGVRRRL